MRPRKKATDISEEARSRQQSAAMNEELLIALVRQHELMETANTLNEQLQSEIAERREAEEALRESESKYRLLFENVLEGIFYGRMISDENGGPSDFIFLDTNAAFARLTGVEDAVGRKFTEVFPGGKASNPELMEIYNRVVTTGRPEKFELEFGPLRAWFAVSAYSVCEEYFVATFDDITERKKVENVMRARLRLSVTADDMTQEEILRNTLDEIEALTQSRIGFYHILEAGQVTPSLQSWSTNTLNNMYTAEGKGRHYPVPGAGVWVDCLREQRPVIHNDYASLPNRNELPPGHAPVTRLMLIPIVRGGRVTAIIGVGNKPDNYNGADVETVAVLGDISWEIIERKRVEETLRASELSYRQLFESAHDGILLLDADEGAVHDVNPSLLEMLGYSHEEMVGKKFWDIVPVKDIETARIVFETLPKVGKLHYESLPFQTGDGRVIEAELTSSVYEAGQTRVIQCNVRDISERKALEQRKADFYAMITHDIKSPLTVLSGYSEILMSKANEFDADTGVMVAAIIKSCVKIGTLIDNFMVVEKAKDGRIVVNYAPTDITKLLKDARQEIEMAAREKKLDLQTEIADGLPRATVDARLIQRAVLNLLQNAVNFTPSPGKVTLKAALEGTDVILISVTDTGAGIPPGEHDAIFGKYFRSKRTSKVQGSGLGLAIVKAAAEAHGGRVEVESKAGKGSTFRLFIPVNTSAGQAS